MSAHCAANGNADDGDCTVHKHPSKMYSGKAWGMAKRGGCEYMQERTFTEGRNDMSNVDVV